MGNEKISRALSMSNYNHDKAQPVGAIVAFARSQPTQKCFAEAARLPAPAGEQACLRCVSSSATITTASVSRCGEGCRLRSWMSSALTRSSTSIPSVCSRRSDRFQAQAAARVQEVGKMSLGKPAARARPLPGSSLFPANAGKDVITQSSPGEGRDLSFWWLFLEQVHVL